MKRTSGVLMHVSSLFGDYSIGSFGKEALEFIDFLSDLGFGVWQILPLCMTDEYNSPYKSPSSFALNPYFLDLPTLFAKGLITRDELFSARGRSEYLCEFSRLREERLPLLFKAAERAMSDSECIREVDRFFLEHPYLYSVAHFLALRDENCGKPWQTWERRKPTEERLFFWKFIQHELFSQWQRIKRYAGERGVKIIGDIPIYPSLDSADVWGSLEQFQLDESGYPTELSGAPPDAFSALGQMWGNPIPCYEKMKENGFLWWRERIKFACELYDGVRIDHFRGIDSYWSIPIGASDAREGRWVKGAGRPLIDAIKSEAQGKTVIAEDLGVITDSVRELLSYSGFSGMRVFQFAFPSYSDSPHLPHNYTPDTVAYSATHDNNTTLGYLYELSPATRARIFEYCGYRGENMREGVNYIISTLLRSSSDTVILPIQDILGFGADTRMNFPGRAEGNWAYRVTREQIFSLDRAALLERNRLFGRA